MQGSRTAKVKKQGRDDHKTVKYTTPTGIFFHNTCITKKDMRGFVYLTVIWSSLPLLLVYVIFFGSRRMPELRFASHSHRSLSSQGSIYTIDSGTSYIGSIGWRITDPSIRSNTKSTLPWMDDKASSPCLSQDWGYPFKKHGQYFTYSFFHSDTFIFMIGT